jgi:hypothetical protein
MNSIRVMIDALIAVGCRSGVDERSGSPYSPYFLWRLTYLDAVAPEIPISAATCAIGRVRQRSISLRRPSTVSGALAWVMWLRHRAGVC